MSLGSIGPEGHAFYQTDGNATSGLSRSLKFAQTKGSLV